MIKHFKLYTKKADTLTKKGATAVGGNGVGGGRGVPSRVTGTPVSSARGAMTRAVRLRAAAIKFHGRPWASYAEFGASIMVHGDLNMVYRKPWPKRQTRPPHIHPLAPVQAWSVALQPGPSCTQ
jgi:hypothetical protein